MPSPPPIAANTQLELNFEGPPAPDSASRYEPLLTVAEACTAFNLKPHVLRRAIKSGAIPAYHFGNDRIRVRASDIDTAIQASARGGAK
jgi:excisionase family DNA binding protein